MEVGIIGCKNLHVPKEISNPDIYVYVTLSYPAESSQTLQTPSKSKTLDPGTYAYLTEILLCSFFEVLTSLSTEQCSIQLRRQI